MDLRRACSTFGRSHQNQMGDPRGHHGHWHQLGEVRGGRLGRVNDVSWETELLMLGDIRRCYCNNDFSWEGSLTVGLKAHSLVKHAARHSHLSITRFETPETLVGLVESMDSKAGKILSAICGRLVQNYRHMRSGMPDLCLWNRDDKKWILVEVKGPNDKLSTKQVKVLEDVLEEFWAV